MPLDAQAAVLLKELAAEGFSPNPSMSPEEMRGLTIQSKQTAKPPELFRVDDRTIRGGEGRDMKVRVYQPKAAPSGGVVVYFHGGGWVLGSLDTHDVQVRQMSKLSGLTYVSMDYRLAPENPFPAAAEDAYAAVSWVSESVGELGADAARLAVAGDSAGGNLAAVAALMARDRGGPHIAFQLLAYPCCDFDTSLWPSMAENSRGPILTRELMEWFVRHYAGDSDPAHEYFSPLRAADHSGLPPGLLITAEYDPLRDEGEAYAAKLRESGVDVKLARYDGLFHGFMGFSDRLDRAAAAQSEAAAVLKAGLTG